MKKKKDGIAAVIVIALLCILALTAVAACIVFSDRLSAAASVKKLQNGLYMMEYDGDYGFNDYLARGGSVSDDRTSEYVSEFLSGGLYRAKSVSADAGCSTIAGRTAFNEYLFGRNYDWADCTTMIVKTKPTDGYASIATCNMDFLGFGKGYVPEGPINRYLAIASIYMPVDGMNEKGLCVADLIVQTKERTDQDSGKTDITTATAIRMLLDNAHDVASAVKLLSQYDMHSSENLMHHLAISDASGRSVVVEYIDNKMYVTDTDVVTNFFLTDGDHYGIGSDQSKDRYSKLMTACADGRNATEEQMMTALKSVNQANYGEDDWMTEWSIVYNKTSLKLDFCFREKYNDPYYEFSLK